MKACIVLQCISGVGDQYTSMLSGHKIYKDLKKLGYDVEITWAMDNQYYPSNISLDYLFDQSCFEGKVSYGKEEAVKSTYIFLPQLQNSIRIYVTEIIPELEGYEAPVYSHAWFFLKLIREENFECIPDIERQYLSEGVLNKVEIFRQGRTAIKGIHFRTQDIHRDRTYEQLIEHPDYLTPINEFKKFILQNKDVEVMVCSNNRNFVDRIEATFPNTFQNKFTYSLPSFYDYPRSYAHTTSRPISEYIEHTQEVAAEMAMFKYCTQIKAYNTFHSSYLSYGIAHNVHYSDWRTKLRSLIYE